MRALPVLALLLFTIAPVRAGAANDDEFNRKFANKLVEVFKDCQKVKPQMTRAELVKLQMFDRDSGPLASVDDKAFKQHVTFFYRSCSLIEIDVDFAPSDSKAERPTDVIAKVSMPYIDARARR